jgi:predicted ester cyclase
MSQARSEEVMRTYLAEVVGKRRYELIPQLAAEDMIDHTQPVKGRQGLVNHVTNFHRTFPDVTIEIKRIVAGENDAVGWWRLKGTHSQELFAQAGTGKVLEFDVVSFFRLKDGMLAEYHVVADALTALTQMGRKLV